MKKFYSFLIAAIIILAIPMGMMGQTTQVSDLTFTAKCNGSGTADDGAAWTVTSDGTESNFDNTSGIHYGTNNAAVTYIQLATSDIDGTISKVVVNCRDAQTIATVSATVNNVAFTCSGSTTATNTSSDYTFTGSASGDVVVRVDRGSSMKKALYVKSVKVTYTTNGGGNTYTVTFDAGDGTFVGNTDFPATTNTKTAGTYTLPSAEKTGYTFNGWLKTGSTEPLTGAYPVNADVNFTASYTQGGSPSTKTLTFDLTSNPGSWPGSESTTLTNYTYTLAGENYTFALLKTYCSSGYLMMKYVAALGLPAIQGYKLTKVVASNSANCSKSTNVGISSSASQASYIAGGASQTWSETSSTYTYTLTSTDENTVYYLYVTNKNAQVTQLQLTYEAAEVNLAVATTVTITSGITNTNVFTGTAAGSLSATVTENTNNTTISGATVTWSSSDETVASINAAGVVTLVAAGSTTITASYAGVENQFRPSSATYELTVINIDPNAGTENQPYTVPEALAAIDANMGITNVYVKGKVSEIVTPFDSQYGNITYNISIDGTGTAAQLQVYRGKSYNGEKFKTANEILVNDNVVVYGTLTLYHNNSTNTDTYEFNTGSQLVSNERTETKTITAHNGGTGGWNLIASPVASITPSAENGFITSNESDYDLYRFNQSATSGEWENWKQSGDHYHFNLVSGQGYLYASKNGANLTFSGTPYNGDGIFNLSYDENVSETGIKGLNLVGNPFSTNASVNKDFYEMNTEGSAVLATVSTSHTIAPMQGIFVKATATGETVTFTPQTSKSNSRSAVVMNLSENSSVIDRAIVCINESRQLPKFQLFENSTKLYITQDNEDFAIVGAEAQGEMPVNFKAEKNGSYTISINAEDVEMNYLHLIDNMTGANVDLLTTPSYSFEAKTDDYASRFRLVFSAQGNANEGATESFAFISGNTFVLNNEGNATLQVIDMLGRVVSTEQVEGNIAHNVPANAGVYVLRLTNGNDVKTQKIVVR